VLLRGSSLDQLFTTVGERFVPLVAGVITTETSPAMLLVATNLRSSHAQCRPTLGIVAQLLAIAIKVTRRTPSGPEWTSN
jgi:hypothetical protein